MAVEGLMHLGVRQYRTDEGLYFFLSRQKIDDFLKKLFHLLIWIREQGKVYYQADVA